jgi:uncharacterized protein YqkB
MVGIDDSTEQYINSLEEENKALKKALYDIADACDCWNASIPRYKARLCLECYKDSDTTEEK